jgi:NADH dehydrogenase
MTEKVVVLGSGYAGAGAINSLESSLDGEADIVWVSDVPYHLVLHESHRCIKDPSVREKITIPIHDIKSPETQFRQGTVVEIDADERTVHLDDGGTVDYDYLLVGIGSETAFFGIDGLEENAHTLKSLDDVLGIHEDITEQAESTDPGDPVQVVVGGAGLSGIQVAGEVAELRDERGYIIDIHLVEGLNEIYPPGTPGLQATLRKLLEKRHVNIHTGKFVQRVDDEAVYLSDDESLDYDVLVWTGGITGRRALNAANLKIDERTNRINAGQDFQTSDERVFAIGDSALIDQPGDEPAPPTAQAAWQAAEVAGENIARAIRGQPLKKWVHKDKGTAISVGEDAVAHDVSVLPFVETFDGLPAKALKKAIAARWISDVDGVGRAIDAWSDM